MSDTSNRDEVSLIVIESVMEPNPVRDLVLRSFPNASEDEIINWEASIEDEIFNLQSCGTWLEADETESALVITDTSRLIDCCCDRSSNFYNVLCCGIRGDDDDSSSVYHVDVEAINSTNVDVGNEIGHEDVQDTGNDIGSGTGLVVTEDDETEVPNVMAFELWSSAIEESFHNMIMGDDDALNDDSSEHQEDEGNVVDDDTISESVATTAPSTLDNTTDDAAGEESITSVIEMMSEEERLRTILANDGMRPHEIERYMIQSRIWHSMYHEIEM